MQSTSSTSSEPAASDSSIIRAGSDGRLRFTPAQRREFLDAFDRSGLSAMAFARSHGVCYQTVSLNCRAPAPPVGEGLAKWRSILLPRRVPKS